MNLSGRVAEARAGVAQRVSTNGWPILQGALAATAAWIIATHVVDHRQPFFAPIAAVVSLNTARGQRGSNAIRLVLGVIVGILVAELVIAIHGRGYGSLGAATLVAMVAALAISGERLVIAQGAAGAILTVATPLGDAGPHRIVDALIGAGVALVISQLLFPPEPVALLRRAEDAAARDLAKGLRLTATALAEEDRSLALDARDALRRMPGPLVDLAEARESSTNTARWAPVWRLASQGPVVREDENAAQLDLLAGSCLMLARAVVALDEPGPAELASAVGELADAIGDAAGSLGDRDARQRAADRALAAAHSAPKTSEIRSPALSMAWSALRTTARDVMVFVGVDQDEAQRALQEAPEALQIATPPHAPRMPFRPGWRR